MKDRRTKYRSTSVLGSVQHCELFCLGVARTLVGPLSQREYDLTIALSHVLSGLKLDDESELAHLRTEVERLTEVNATLTLALQRCLGADVDAG